MHILVTADTVGGVWTYTRELVTGLAQRGIRITLVSFGAIPSASQTAWIEKLKSVAYYPTAFRLEWMQDSAADIADSTSYLRNLVEEVQPDLLHLSQYCYGALDLPLPKVVVAHSDVMTWSITIRGSEPDDAWSRWYRAIVSEGLAGAGVVVAPSRWMLESLEKCHGRQTRSEVIYNGRSPELFNALVSKHDYAASVGRLWDEAKQSQLLLHLSDSPMPIFLAGAETIPGNASADFTKGATKDTQAVQSCGQLSEGEMRQLLSRAAIYIATSKYEPFGLAPLEAALSRCALVAADIPSFREIWDDAAYYVTPGDEESLHNALTVLQSNKSLRLAYANRAYQRALQLYPAKRMVDEYLQLYSALLERGVSAA